MSRTKRMKSSRSNSSTYLQSTRDDKRASARLPSNYSHPIQKVRGLSESEQFSNIIDYQLTVRPKVELTRFRMSMLLELECYFGTIFGLNLTSWIVIEYLFGRLLGSNKVWEVRDPNERRVLTLANMVLLASQNSWMALGEFTQLDKNLIAYLKESNLLSNDRTIQSRKEYWKTESFLEVRAVRLDVVLEREQQTERYSSYCKGYGESSSMGRRRKTRPSAELDGEEERPEVILSLKEIPNLLYLNLLELKKKNSVKKA